VAHICIAKSTEIFMPQTSFALLKLRSRSEFVVVRVYALNVSIE
jgi:hypothetical protein